MWHFLLYKQKETRKGQLKGHLKVDFKHWMWCNYSGAMSCGKEEICTIDPGSSYLIQSFCKAMKDLRAVFVSLPVVGSMPLPHLRKKAIQIVFSVSHNQTNDLCLIFILWDEAGFPVKFYV